MCPSKDQHFTLEMNKSIGFIIHVLLLLLHNTEHS